MDHSSMSVSFFFYFLMVKGRCRGIVPGTRGGIPASSSESHSSPDPHDPVIFEDRADCRMAYAVTFSGTARGSDDREVATR